MSTPESIAPLAVVAPELVALEVLESSIDLFADLLDQLYPDLQLGHDADDTIHNLVILLSKCRTALDDYYTLRTGGRPDAWDWDDTDDNLF